MSRFSAAHVAPAERADLGRLRARRIEETVLCAVSGFRLCALVLQRQSVR